MTYMQISMMYEAEYGSVSSLIMRLLGERVKETELAMRERREPDPAYTEQIEWLKERKAKLRKLSDNAFEAHRRTHNEFDSFGATELGNAILERAALDYENALCKKDERTKAEVERFANETAYLYTDLDPNAILWRIREKHKEFVRLAHSRVRSIAEVTEKIRKQRRHDFSSEENENRCPLCGGGMYIKHHLKSDLVLIGCTGCSLSEVVKYRA